jgi:hypothetical protein
MAFMVSPVDGAEAPVGLGQLLFNSFDKVNRIAMTAIDPLPIYFLLEQLAVFGVNQCADVALLVSHSLFCAVNACHV